MAGAITRGGVRLYRFPEREEYHWPMRRTIMLALAAFTVCALPRSGFSQSTVPVIYLSPAETAHAKQVGENLRQAHDRDRRATTAWESFRNTYQAAHPELPFVRFAADLRIAFAVRNIPGPISREAVIIELSRQEREKAQALQQEMAEARRAAEEAGKEWRDYQNELVSDHIPSATTGGIIFQRSDGKSVTISEPWTNGVAFTPDYRIAVPNRP